MLHCKHRLHIIYALISNQQGVHTVCCLGSGGLLGLICKAFITLLSCHVFIHLMLTVPLAGYYNTIIADTLTARLFFFSLNEVMVRFPLSWMTGEETQELINYD